MNQDTSSYSKMQTCWKSNKHRRWIIGVRNSWWTAEWFLKRFFSQPLGGTTAKNQLLDGKTYGSLWVELQVIWQRGPEHTFKQRWTLAAFVLFIFCLSASVYWMLKWLITATQDKNVYLNFPQTPRVQSSRRPSAESKLPAEWTNSSQS